MARHVVAPMADIPPGARRLVKAGGKRIVVFNLGGEFFALGNRCPHQRGPLHQGPVLGLVEISCPGAHRHERAGEILRCPWHAWEFDIRTGRSRVDPRRTRLRAYPAAVASGATPRAETIDVRVEESFVVVEV